MDQESIVYGCIKDVAPLNHQIERLRTNREAMLCLPFGEAWPFVCQEMFSIPDIDNLNTNYHTQVMHFGASYKAVEYEWEQWVKEFESLLSKMYWVSATVHLETELYGIHTFIWEAAGGNHVPGAGNIKVRCEWSREGALA